MLLAAVAAGDDVRVTLTVDTIRFVGSSNNPVNFTTRAYNGQIPGPAIRVRQGDTLRITLHNRLGAQPPPDPTPNTFTKSVRRKIYFANVALLSRVFARGCVKEKEV